MDTKDINDLEEIIAYHEAGHAVVAWSLSVPIRDISVGSLTGKARDGLGARQLDPELNCEADRRWAEKTALILLGGEFAERTYNECHDYQSEIYCSDEDRDQLQIVVQGLFGSADLASKDWVKQVESQVDQIVLKNWERISALAEELLAKRHLSGDETLQIIQLSNG